MAHILEGLIRGDKENARMVVGEREGKNTEVLGKEKCLGARRSFLYISVKSNSA